MRSGSESFANQHQREIIKKITSLGSKIERWVFCNRRFLWHKRFRFRLWNGVQKERRCTWKQGSALNWSNILFVKRLCCLLMAIHKRVFLMSRTDNLLIFRKVTRKIQTFVLFSTRMSPPPPRDLLFVLEISSKGSLFGCFVGCDGLSSNLLHFFSSWAGWRGCGCSKFGNEFHMLISGRF